MKNKVSLPFIGDNYNPVVIQKATLISSNSIAIYRIGNNSAYYNGRPFLMRYYKKIASY